MSALRPAIDQTRLERVAALICGPLTIVFAVAGIHQDQGGPPNTDSGAKVLAYVQTHGSSAGGGAFSLLLAVIFGLLFYGLVARLLGRSRQTAWLTAVGFGGALILAVAALVEAGVDFAISDVGGQVEAATAQVLNLLQTELNQMMIPAGLAVAMLGFGIAMLRGHVLPRPLGWGTVVIGLLAAAGPLVRIALPLEALWIVAMGVVILQADNAPVPQPSRIEDLVTQ